VKRVGFLGAYSIDNAGDQLLGYAARQAIRARAPRAEQVLLAPAFRGDMWRHAWDAARGIDLEVRKIPPGDSVTWAKGLDAVIIGGGELIRLEPDFRPFILGEASDWEALSPAVPAAWNAIGAENAPAYLADQRPTYRAVKRCCDALAYVSVRNETTLRFVRRCGFVGAAPLVPDPTMLMTLPPAPGRGDAILADAGVDVRKDVIGISVGTSLRDPRAGSFYKELFAELLARRGPAELVLFAFGNVYGDVELQKLALAALPGAKMITAPLSATDRWRLIGALDLHVCTRYHAMLAAFAQDVPFVVLDEYLADLGVSSKIRDFVAATELEGFYMCPFVSKAPRQKLANAMTLAGAPGFSFEARIKAMQRDLGAHYDAMAKALALV
jgi:polysaccharide pyruvyl transferase WcaK-like protein